MATHANTQPAGRIMLRNVRLAFPSLFEPSAYGEGEPSFQATLIMDHQASEPVVRAMAAVAREKWGAKADAQIKALVSQGKVCLRNGDEKPDYDGFAGMMFVAARSKTRPTVVDGQRNPLTERDGRIYAGCWVNASIEIWAQDNAYGKRINATLRGIQFVRDGEAFGGGRPAAADEFDELEDADALV
jgi:hypothetical protein